MAFAVFGDGSPLRSPNRLLDPTPADVSISALAAHALGPTWVSSALGGITLTSMNHGFCRFPQTRSWHETRERLAELQGAAVTDASDDPVVGSWIDFTFRGYSFTINAESGEFVFFAENTDCPESVRGEVTAHFASFFAERADHGDEGDITLRRV